MLIHQNSCVYTSGLERGVMWAQKSACTSSSFFVIAVMLLFYFVICIDLLPTQGAQILSRISVSVTQSAVIMALTLACLRVFLLSQTSKSSKSTSIFAGSYSLLSSSFIFLTSFAVLSTQVLLAWTNRRCQSQTRLLWLTRYVGRPYPVMAIAQCLILLGGLMTAMAFPGSAKSSIKRFHSLLASAMTFSFLINVIVIGLSYYMILPS